MNYFKPKTSAERYAKGRPDFHINTIRKINAYLQLNQKLDAVLDVACGTGLSTMPLLELAKTVYGTDPSQEMLNNARTHDSVFYALASADKQPFADEAFDLITVSSGVHWFDNDAFLAEANRLLKSRSWLVLYDNFFIAEMANNHLFTDWFQAVYLKKFPAPTRNDTYPWTTANLATKNFDFVTEDSFKNEINFNKNQLTAYFTSQSNIIVAVEQHETTYEAVEDWLNTELSLFFENDNMIQTIHYGNWIKYLQRLH